MKEYIYHNKDGVRRTLYTGDDVPGMFVTKAEVDVTSLVDNNARLADLHPERSINKHVARVPLTVYEQSIHEDWGDDDWKRWLNDPDNAAFRVWKGKV